jgi:hypothetical protein
MPIATPVRAGRTLPIARPLIRHADRDARPCRKNAADRDAVAVVIQHDETRRHLRIDARRSAEVAHLRVCRDARVEPDQSEVLRILQDRISELADANVAGVARLRSFAGRPRHLADVTPDGRLAENAVTGGAHVEDAVASREQEVEAALTGVAVDDRAGPHAIARPDPHRRRERNFDQARRHAAERPVRLPASSATGEETGMRRPRPRQTNRDHGALEHETC